MGGRTPSELPRSQEGKSPVSSGMTPSFKSGKSNPRGRSTVAKTQGGESGEVCSIPFSSGLVNTLLGQSPGIPAQRGSGTLLAKLCPLKHSHACKLQADDLWRYLCPPVSPDKHQGGNYVR